MLIPAGQKTCAHIHGVFPYIYILDDPSIEHSETVIATCLDNAINSELGKTNANASARFHHVFKVTRVTGKTFYGYRRNDEVFLKIFFYNPFVIKNAMKLLLVCTVKKTICI